MKDIFDFHDISDVAETLGIRHKKKDYLGMDIRFLFERAKEAGINELSVEQVAVLYQRLFILKYDSEKVPGTLKRIDNGIPPTKIGNPKGSTASFLDKRKRTPKTFLQIANKLVGMAKDKKLGIKRVKGKRGIYCLD